MAIYRASAKVLLIDEDGQVLLLSGIDRTKPDLAPVVVSRRWCSH
jgi:hypothetical protein